MFLNTSINKFRIQAFLALILILSTSIPAIGQSQATTYQTDTTVEVMILGTGHFGNPGQDVINIKFPDVLKPKYQKQVGQVLDSLATFNPTKMAVEVRPSYKSKFDSLYKAYLEGSHSLSRNERQQIGFRIGKRFNHSHLYSIDHKGKFPFTKVVKYARQHNPQFVNYFKALRKEIESEDQELYNNATIREILQEKNSPQNLQKQRDFYAQTAAVGADTTWVGAKLVSQWHKRNIKIFGHLAKIAEEGDRIIVLFGSGHAPLLRYFVNSSKRMKLVEPLDYL
ncbi:DUF5694 domain-containing protein [Fodinibius saliphilus]|uniref:DUF5694 domain-containing protein n=1 Tax=Fodinibius saliphilus TaxID=1920650 RepID=UPI001107E243|nr:DUF5694 domain-containing protein [Fodinibius saliphilus]